EERLKDRHEPEAAHTMQVEHLRLVVERHHAVASARAQCPRQLDRGLVGLALRLHERDELGRGEIAGIVEGGGFQILVDGHPSHFPGAHDFAVPPVEVFGIEPESRDGGRTLTAVTAVGAEHAANVKEQMRNRHHAAASVSRLRLSVASSVSYAVANFSIPSVSRVRVTSAKSIPLVASACMTC